MTSHNAVARLAPVPKPSQLQPVTFPTREERDAWSRAVACDRRLPVSAKVIAIEFVLSEGDPTSYEEISEALGVSRRTAIRGVARLVDCGWLQKTTSKGRVPNVYRCVMRVPS